MKWIVVSAGILGVTIAVAVVGYFLGAEEIAALRAATLGLMTLLIVGGGTYLVVYARRMRQLDLPADDMGANEVLWAKTSGSMVHYRSGNPWKFWETVGGRLFLTSDVLEFRANPAEIRPYRIVIPLREIRRARACALFGIIRGGLRIERTDGTFELFTFGAAFDVSRAWADAIEEFRDDLVELEESAG